MAPQNLVGKADALTADENARAGDQTHPALTLELPAERTLRLVPFDLAALRFASEDHPAATFSFSFSPSLSFALSLSPSLGGLRMMSSISPYSFAASDVRK
jgi:hypothetical protein